MKNLGLILVIVLLGSGIFTFVIPVVPVSVEEPYQVQVPYDVQVPYTVNVEVTKTNILVDHSFSLGDATFKTLDFIMTSNQNVKIYWNSTNEVALFAVMKQSTYDSFYRALISKVGLPVVMTLTSGGCPDRLTILLIVSTLPDIMNAVASGDYYKLSSDLYMGLLGVKRGELVVINIAYGVSAWAEYLPSMVAAIRQLIWQGAKLIMWSSHVDGDLSYKKLLEEVPEFKKLFYGVDWAYLGYYTGGEAAVAQIATSIKSVFPRDAYGTALDQFPITYKLNTAKDIRMVISDDTGDWLDYYIRQWFIPYGIPVGEVGSAVLGLNGETTTKNLEANSYKLLVISFGPSGDLYAKLSYDYKTTEIETRYRTETRYKSETHFITIKKTVTIWSYLTKSF
jgi:hypothetical protein